MANIDKEYVTNVEMAISEESLKFRKEEDRVLEEMGLERYPPDGGENEQLRDLDFLVVRSSLLRLAGNRIEHNPHAAVKTIEYLRKDPDGTAWIRLTLPRVTFFTPPRYLCPNRKRAPGHMKGDIYLDTEE